MAIEPKCEARNVPPDDDGYCLCNLPPDHPSLSHRCCCGVEWEQVDGDNGRRFR